MDNLILYFLFALAGVFSFYIPGKLFIEALSIKLEYWQLFILNWVSGIALFILFTYITAWLNIPYLYPYILLILFIFFLLKRKFSFYFVKQIKNLDRLTILFVLTGTLAFLLTMFFSGMQTSDGIRFMGINAADGVRHISYIKSQTIFFPPQRPELAGDAFRGFHYFYDFMLSRFILFYNFSAEDLYFRLFPALIGALYGLSFYLFSSLLTKSKVAQRFSVLFAYFLQSSLFVLLPFLNSADLTNDAVVQPLGLMVNPFTVTGIIFLMCGLALLPHIKNSIKYAIIVGLLFGIISQVKVYTGIIAIITITAFFVYIIVKYRFKYFMSYLSACLLTAILTIITFFPNNYGSAGLIYSPFLFYREYMQRGLLNPLNWEIRRIIFSENNNILRLFILYLEAIGLFVLINLGLRLIVFTKIKSVFQKSFWKNEYNFILLVSVLAPVLIMSLFIQTVSVFDTVQFFWIVLAILSIPTAIVTGELWEKYGVKIKLILVMLILIFSAPGTFDILYKYLNFEKALFVPNSTLNFYHAINHLIPEREFIIYLPDEVSLRPNSEFGYSGTMLEGALTGRAVYYSAGGIHGKDVQKFKARRDILFELHNALEKCDQNKIKGIINKIGSKNILTSTIYPCLVNEMNLKTKIARENLFFYQL